MGINHKQALIPLVLGSIFFYMVVGPGPLDPQNLSWIFGRFDPPQHYLGWIFYRHSEWSFPIGLNPNYGIDIGNSIVFTDSLPILAIPFKLISPLLPNIFQYLGIWLFICFVLQAYFSYKVVSLFSNNSWILLFATTLLAFAPPMFWRANTPSGTQAALASHFLILASFYLILRNDQSRRLIYWGAVLSIATLTHFYIFVMVSTIWMSGLIDCVVSQKRLTKKQAIFEILGIFILVLVCAWQAGYFAISSSSGIEQGYGFLKLNLLSPIDPNGWSYILPNIPIQTTWGEGFNYFGLGIILTLIFSVGILLLPKQAGKHLTNKSLLMQVMHHRFLLMALLILLLDAITNNIGIGPKELHFDLPEFLHAPLNVLRSSARMYWPIHYWLIICALFLIIKKCSTRISIFILCLLASVQIVDTSQGWLSIRKSLGTDMSSEMDSPLLKDPFWKSAAKRYKKIMRIPAGTQTLNWLQFATLASNNRMSTNSVYLARIDNAKVTEANTKLQKIIQNGKFDPETLYILDRPYVLPSLATAGKNDLIAKIDGFFILAPEWLKCTSCPKVSDNQVVKLVDFLPKNKNRIEFSDLQKDQQAIFYLGDGWSWQESWGTWSDSRKATLNIPWPQQKPRALKLTLKSFVVTNKHPTQPLNIYVNGSLYQNNLLSDFDNNFLEILISKNMLSRPLMTIEFDIPNPGQPSQLFPGNKDQRQLGIGLKSIYFD